MTDNYKKPHGLFYPAVFYGLFYGLSVINFCFKTSNTKNNKTA